VPTRIGPIRRLSAIATAPVGVALTSWSYIWRITPVHRSERDGAPEEDCPPPLPPGVSHEEVQLPEDGSGPLFRRTYSGAIRDPTRDAAKLIEHVSADPNRVVPLSLARFNKTHGEPWRMAVGDEFLIRMLGPWDGPVRAIEVTPTSFRFATLAGHLEAGQIEWRAHDDGGRVVFQIESRSRAGDRLSALLHDRARMAKEVQLHMWTSVIEHVAREAGGALDGGVSVETRRVAFPSS
jgi:hypothetical protein